MEIMGSKGTSAEDALAHFKRMRACLGGWLAVAAHGCVVKILSFRSLLVLLPLLMLLLLSLGVAFF